MKLWLLAINWNQNQKGSQSLVCILAVDIVVVVISFARTNETKTKIETLLVLFFVIDERQRICTWPRASTAMNWTLSER